MLMGSFFVVFEMVHRMMVFLSFGDFFLVCYFLLTCKQETSLFLFIKT